MACTVPVAVGILQDIFHVKTLIVQSEICRALLTACVRWDRVFNNNLSRWLSKLPERIVNERLRRVYKTWCFNLSTSIVGRLHGKESPREMLRFERARYKCIMSNKFEKPLLYWQSIYNLCTVSYLEVKKKHLHK